MKQKLLSLLMMLLPLMAHAEAVEIDGIYYNLINEANLAEVTENPNKYTGIVVIPSSVVYNDVIYSVTSIGAYAFVSCKDMSSITIPNSITSIGDYAFGGCSGLNSITIPNSVTSIGGHVFNYCVGLTSVTIPNSVTSIENYAFYGCTGLTSITIPNSVTSIGDEAFRDCKGLIIVTIPNSVTSIGDGAFENCFSLTSVTIPNSVTSIGGRAFFNCSGLTSITIPNSVSFIESQVFQGCIGLTSVTIPNSVTVIGSKAFSGCSGLTSITIPNSVTSIGERAFVGCTDLTSITIPNSVTYIKSSAFSNCSGLTSVTIGSGVKKIYEKAFAYCPELTDVYCSAENEPSTNTTAFDGSNIEHATLHVPASTVNAYKNSEPWSKFKNKVVIGMQYYTLTYMVDGTKYKEYSIGEGDNITPEPAPTKQGYTFSGWSAIPAAMPANDVTVTGTFIKNAATTYTLTYMVDGQVYKTFYYEAGATVERVEAPTKEGYTFSGWSNTMLTMPERNVTITGTFTKNAPTTYKLTYMIDGKVYKASDYAAGAAIIAEPAPTKEGYTFSGWSTIPATMPAYDVTINGSFNKTASYTLTYMVNGEVYKTVNYEYGEKITPEPEPTRKGATFSGWSWIPSKMPDEDVVVTGTFNMEKYKLTYKVDGADYKILEVEVGSAITPEPEPTKDGYTFSGWSWIPKKMPDEDVTITGTFTPSTGVKTAVGSGRPFDVYTVTGRKVRSQVTSLKGLKKGVYIVEGRKVVVSSAVK